MAEKTRSNNVPIVVGVLALAVVAAGVCYALFRPTDARVSGTVTLDGQPVDGAQVVFLRHGEEHPRPVLSRTDDAGAYTLTEPIPAGKYKVVVSKEAAADGTVPTGPKLERARIDGSLRNILPSAYEDKSTTPLLKDVPRGAVTLDLELKKQP
jgi:hypothetical protein